MPESSIALVHRFYDAMHAGDVAGLLATLAPDFVGHVSEGIPGGYGGAHVGGEHNLRDCWAPNHPPVRALPHPARAPAGEPRPPPRPRLNRRNRPATPPAVPPHCRHA